MKKFASMLLALLLTVSMSFPVFADSQKDYILDELDVLGDSEEALNDAAEKKFKETGVNIVFATVPDCGGDTVYKRAGKIYSQEFGDEPGMILLHADEECKIAIFETRHLEEKLSGDDADALMTAYNQADTYENGVKDYYNKAGKILQSYGFTAADTSSKNENKSDKQESSKKEDSGKREFSRIMDEADLLSDDEEKALLSKLDEISERQEMDVVVLINDSLGEKTATEYADDAFDYRHFGYGPDKDGILLLVSMEERDFAISTHGKAVEYFTDAGLEYMADQFMPEIGNDNYAEGFDMYAELCDEFITQAEKDVPYGEGNLPEEGNNTVSPFWIPADFLLGGGIALLFAKRKKKELISVEEQRNAADYTRDESLDMSQKRDSFVKRVVTSQLIDDGDNGGSSTHTSSSGETHGGISGKF